MDDPVIFDRIILFTLAIITIVVLFQATPPVRALIGLLG